MSISSAASLGPKALFRLILIEGLLALPASPLVWSVRSTALALFSLFSDAWAPSSDKAIAGLTAQVAAMSWHSIVASWEVLGIVGQFSFGLADDRWIPWLLATSASDFRAHSHRATLVWRAYMTFLEWQLAAIRDRAEAQALQRMFQELDDDSSCSS